VESWDFVIQELVIGYTGKGIVVCRFIVKEVYVLNKNLSIIYDKEKLIVPLIMAYWKSI